MPVAAQAVASESFGHGVLWMVSTPEAPDSYVFGTIHAADPRVLAAAAEVDRPLAASRTLAMELVTDATFTGGIAELEQFQDGQDLPSLVGRSAFERIRARLLEQGLGDSAIRKMKPWAAMVMLSKRTPAVDEPTLDQALLARARRGKVHVIALEWLEEQVAAFDSIPLDSQVALLLDALDHRDALEAEQAFAVDAWLRGDLAAIADFPERASRRTPGMGGHYRQLARHLIDNRTVLMHHRLVLPLRTGRLFVAIGALHLPGERGLLAMLAEDGYRVTRMS